MDRKYIVRLFNEFQMYADQVERLEKELNEQSKINDIFDNYINNDCITLRIDETIEKLKDAGASSEQIIGMGFEEDKVKNLFNERDLHFPEDIDLDK